jgi:hypothetical protein
MRSSKPSSDFVIRYFWNDNFSLIELFITILEASFSLFNF